MLRINTFQNEMEIRKKAKSDVLNYIASQGKGFYYVSGEMWVIVQNYSGFYFNNQDGLSRYLKIAREENPNISLKPNELPLVKNKDGFFYIPETNLGMRCKRNKNGICEYFYTLESIVELTVDIAKINNLNPDPQEIEDKLKAIRT